MYSPLGTHLRYLIYFLEQVQEYSLQNIKNNEKLKPIYMFINIRTSKTECSHTKEYDIATEKEIDG